jgi:signal peptidase I
MHRRHEDFLSVSHKMQTDAQGNASMEMACGLAEEVIRTFGEVRLRVFGTSMVPAMLPGDLVTVRRATMDEISAGEVVLFAQNGRLFVHRVVSQKAIVPAGKTEDACLATRGDRLHHEDPPVSSLELLGRVISLERDNRKIALEMREPRGTFARLLRASDRATYLYVRMFAGWRSLFFRGVKCRV